MVGSWSGIDGNCVCWTRLAANHHQTSHKSSRTGFGDGQCLTSCPQATSARAPPDSPKRGRLAPIRLPFVVTRSGEFLECNEERRWRAVLPVSIAGALRPLLQFHQGKDG